MPLVWLASCCIPCMPFPIDMFHIYAVSPKKLNLCYICWYWTRIVGVIWRRNRGTFFETQCIAAEQQQTVDMHNYGTYRKWRYSIISLSWQQRIRFRIQAKLYTSLYGTSANRKNESTWTIMPRISMRRKTIQITCFRKITCFTFADPFVSLT